jgi:membrane complex biogenesis BtpA family protein
MIHLPALPGAPGFGGSMERVIERATTDARSLDEAGFDGLLVENYGDVPFFRGRVPSETVAAITAALVAIRGASRLPVGVNVLRNDPVSAVGIAAATGARFVRANVHTGSMWTDQGLIEGRAAETMRTRAALGCVRKKHRNRSRRCRSGARPRSGGRYPGRFGHDDRKRA